MIQRILSPLVSSTMPRILPLLMLSSVALFAGTAIGQEGHSNDKIPGVPGDHTNASLATVQVNISKLTESKLGNMLIRSWTEAMLFDDGGEMSSEEQYRHVTAGLGFDPAEQGIKLAVLWMSSDQAKGALWADLELKGPIAKAQEAVRSVPENYTFEDAGLTIYTFKLHDVDHLVTFRDGDADHHHITGGHSLKAIKQAVDAVKSDSTSKLVKHDLPDDQLVSVVLHSVSENIFGLPVGSKTITDLLETVDFSLSQTGDDFLASVELTAKDEQQATKLVKITEGLIAAADVFQADFADKLGGEKAASQILPLLRKATVEHNQNVLQIQVILPETLLINFLQNETRLP